jgi:hypothetical protein
MQDVDAAGKTAVDTTGGRIVGLFADIDKFRNGDGCQHAGDGDDENDPDQGEPALSVACPGIG